MGDILRVSSSLSNLNPLKPVNLILLKPSPANSDFYVQSLFIEVCGNLYRGSWTDIHGLDAAVSEAGAGVGKADGKGGKAACLPAALLLHREGSELDASQTLLRYSPTASLRAYRVVLLLIEWLCDLEQMLTSVPILTGCHGLGIGLSSGVINLIHHQTIGFEADVYKFASMQLQQLRQNLVRIALDSKNRINWVKSALEIPCCNMSIYGIIDECHFITGTAFRAGSQRECMQH
ncbi:hypothetical protein B0H14DRAFT_2581158 [Mycena olivaceomarginata]|nr:hypothetical protein B0H14DRAFT_2581158 [Mycena olivaceomarginata]